MHRNILYFGFLAAALLGQAQEAEKPEIPSDFPIKIRSSSGKDRVAVGNSIEIKEGEVVKDVVVVGGSAIINGKVTGDLVVVCGKAEIGPKAELLRDLVVVAGAVDIHTNAIIKGEQRVMVGPNINFGVPRALKWVPQWFSQGLLLGRPLPHQYAWAWIVAGLFILFYLLLALLFPGAIRASVTVLETRPGSSLLTGLLAFLLIGPLLILLLITVIGSILIPFLLCGAVAAYFFGKVVVYTYAGRQILGERFQKPLVPVLIGAVLFCLLYAIPFLGFLVWGVAAPLGVGAVLLAFFGRLRTEKPTPPVPPPPSAPPPPMGTEPAPATSASLMTSTPPAWAGFWLRFLGTVIDAILVFTICRLLRVEMDHGPILIVIWTLYHIVLWGLKGATVGGLVVGARIIRTDGGPINFSVAVVRSLASFLSAAALMLGFFWAGWSPRKQSWHDIIAGTFVVKTGRSLQSHPLPAPASANQ